MLDVSFLKNKISEGYAYHKVVVQDEEVVDYIFLDINEMFTECTGLGPEVLGRRVTEVIPGLEQAQFNWISVYGEIALNGGETLFRAYSEPLGKWYQVKVFSDKKGYFATLFQEIIDQEKDQLQNQLLESQVMFDASQTAMFLVKVNGNNEFIYLKNNQPHQEATGFTEENITGKSPVELAGQEQGTAIQANYAQCVQAKDQIHYEETLELPGGRKVWKTTLTPIIDYTGTVTHIVGSSQDVTEYKRANENLEKNKNILNKLIEYSPLGIFQINEKGEYIEANSMGCTILGYSRDEILSMTIADVLDDSYFSKGRDHFNELVEKGFAQSELLMKSKSGQALWIDLSAAKISEDRYIGYFKEITDEIRAKKRLMESEARNRSIIKSAKTVSLILTDLNSIVREFSPGAENIFGYRREEIIGKSVAPLHTESETQKLPEYIEILKREKDGFTIETELIRKSGEKFPAYFTLQPIFDNEGTLSATLGVTTDISDLKKKEKQLNELIKEQELLLDNIEEQIWYLKDIETYGAVNKAHANFFGSLKSELEHRTIWEIMGSKEEAEMFIEGNKQVFEEKRQIKSEEWIVDGHGEQRLLAITKTPKLDTAGEVEFVVCAADDITQRKQAEEQSRFLSHILANTFDSVVVTDDTFKITYINKAAEELFGYDLEEIMGHSSHVFLAEPMIEEVQTQIYDTVSSGGVYENTLLTKRKDGSTFQCDFKVKPVVDNNGRVYAYLGIQRDVTEHKKVEKDLKESRELFNKVIEATNDGVWDWDIVSGEAYFSDNYYTMLGYEPGAFEANYDSWRNLLHPEDITTVEKTIQQCFKGQKEGFDIQFRARTKNGSYKWVRGRGKIVERDEHGHPIRAVGTNIDIHDSKEKEQKEIETKRLLEGTINAVSDVIGIQKTDHTIYQYNQAGYDMLKLTPEEVEGRKCYELLGREERCENCPTSKALESKQLETVEKYIPDMDSHLLVRANPIFNHEGEIDYIIEQIQNITPQKQVEKHLQEYNVELEHKNLKINNLYAQLMEEIQKARIVHERLLPSNIDNIKNVSIESYYQPAENIGADFYNVTSQGNKLVFFISDVAGHGLDGAIVSAFVKESIDSYIRLEPEAIRPKNIVEHLYKQYQAEEYPDDTFISLVLGVLDFESYELNYIGVGFQESILVSFANGENLELKVEGLPITKAVSEEHMTFNVKSIQLQSDTALMIYSDGLTEQENSKGETFREQLFDIFFSNRELPATVIKEEINDNFRRFNDGNSQGDDDISYLILKVDESAADFCATYESSFDELEQLNLEIFECLKNYTSNDIYYQGIYELIVNAIEHGNKFDENKKVYVRFKDIKNKLIVTVEDEGDGFDWRYVLDDKDLALDQGKERGRGLPMTKLLCSSLYYNKAGNKAFLILDKNCPF